jgi:hypothetical protein
MIANTISKAIDSGLAPGILLRLKCEQEKCSYVFGFDNLSSIYLHYLANNILNRHRVINAHKSPYHLDFYALRQISTFNFFSLN